MRIKTDIPLSISFIKEAIGIKPCCNDENIIINAISTDSREIKKKDLFIPLKGENFDAETFVTHAVNSGAYSLSVCKYDFDTIIVDDTVAALLKIAKAYKNLLSLKCTIAITGSVGKTTTKNLTISLLSEKYRVFGTPGNHNNEIGVPLTILSAKRDTEILVIEAGMNHYGELSKISQCIEPDIAVITKIGTAHIGNLGNRENIAKAKCEILSGMKKPFAIIPFDEPLLSSIVNKKTVSTNDSNADVYLSSKEMSKHEMYFDYFSKALNLKDIKLGFNAAHIPECLAFALAVCEELGMSSEDMAYALLKTKNLNNIKIEHIGNITVIDDSYNSSAESVDFAFKTLQIYNKNKCSAVLGDMLELGEHSEKLHIKIGKIAGNSKISSLYAFGKYSNFVKSGAIEAGMDENCIFTNTDIDGHDITAAQVISNLSDDETILFKGSRKMKMEKIINTLKIMYNL